MSSAAEILFSSGGCISRTRHQVVCELRGDIRSRVTLKEFGESEGCASGHDIGVVSVCFSAVAANWKSGHDLSVVCEEGTIVDQRPCATY